MYQVVKKEQRTIRGPDNQPMPGYLVTVSDSETGDSFSVEVPSLQEDVVKDRVQLELNRRRNVDNLSWL